MRKRYKLVKKKMVVVEIGFLEIEEKVEEELVIEEVIQQKEDTEVKKELVI